MALETEVVMLSVFYDQIHSVKDPLDHNELDPDETPLPIGEFSLKLINDES